MTQSLSEFFGNARHEFMPGILGLTKTQNVILLGYETVYESKSHAWHFGMDKTPKWYFNGL